LTFREERAAERKASIIKAAAKVFSKKGYHETTVEEIAREIRHTKGSIYYYVKRKQDLLFECHDLAMTMLLDSLDRILASGLAPGLMLKEAIRNHIRILAGELHLLTVALGSDYLLEDKYARVIFQKRDAYETRIRNIIREGMNQGVFRPVQQKLAAFVILGAANWIPRWYSEQGPLPIEEIANFWADYLVAPLTGAHPDGGKDGHPGQ